MLPGAGGVREDDVSAGAAGTWVAERAPVSEARDVARCNCREDVCHVVLTGGALVLSPMTSAPEGRRGGTSWIMKAFPFDVRDDSESARGTVSRKSGAWG